jgi:hypothetical protein
VVNLARNRVVNISIIYSLTTILSIIYLYDITTITESELAFKLNGYKSINGSIEFSQLKVDVGYQYYNIYKWVYNSGNFNDKLGLARNIISLHLKLGSGVQMHGDPYRSLQSSYKVYEQDNIKQYIAIRNNISDQLLNFHDRANKIVESFASGFQKSGLALISFYISAIILKVLTKDKLIEVFTLDSSVLSTAFILCSLLYLRVSRWELREQKKRFVNNYHDLKRRYTDLLDWQDIQRILNQDHEYTEDINFINAKLRIYSQMWVSFLIILFLTTWFLFLIYKF